MRKKLVLVILIGFCFFGGIASGEQKYQRPTVNSPAQFRGSDSIPDSNSIGNLKWFEIFKDKQLQALIRIALAQNYDLRLAMARTDAARANLGITRSNQYPQFAVGGNVNDTQQSLNNLEFSPPRTRSIATIFLNMLNFEIDVWGRLRHQTEAAAALLQASDDDRKTVMMTLISDVATAYFNLLELDMELDIDKRTLANREESLRLIKLREEGGVATLLDVREAEQLVYSASVTIPDTQRQIEQAEDLINLLLGNNPGSIPRGTPLDEQTQPPSVPAGLPSALLERRPDIRSAEQNLVAQHALVYVAKAAYFPQISLTGLIGFQSNQLSNLFTGPSRTWTLLPQVTQPIFTAGLLSSNVELAKANQQLALISYEQAIKSAFRDVSDALIQYRRVREIRTQQELLTAAVKDRSKLAYLRYNGGVDTLLNALDADRDLFNAEISLAQNKREEMLSLVQLYKTLGGGWQQ